MNSLKKIKSTSILMFFLIALSEVLPKPKEIDFGKIQPIHPFHLLDKESAYYIIDCAEKQECMDKCPIGGRLNSRNDLNFNAPRKGCLRECSNIICLKRK